MKLNVQAIFSSIDGEANGFNGAGELTTFIRLKGCNLNCQWCDTKYAQESKPENWMTTDEIIQQIHFPKVTVTGGEPLLQRTRLLPLVEILLTNAYRITIETNGTEPPFAEIDTSFQKLRYVVDYKLPSSGMEDEMNLEVFKNLELTDVIKFVISDMKDYKRACEVVKSNPSWEAKMVFSPALGGLHAFAVPSTGGNIKSVFNMDWPRQLAEMMIRDKVDAQFSLQIHKVLWPRAKEER